MGDTAREFPSIETPSPCPPFTYSCCCAPEGTHAPFLAGRPLIHPSVRPSASESTASFCSSVLPYPPTTTVAAPRGGPSLRREKDDLHEEAALPYIRIILPVQLCLGAPPFYLPFPRCLFCSSESSSARARSWPVSFRLLSASGANVGAKVIISCGARASGQVRGGRLLIHY